MGPAERSPVLVWKKRQGNWQMVRSSHLTYAQTSDTRWKRWLIRGVERLTGAQRIQQMYDEVSACPVDRFWGEALTALQIDVRCPDPIPLPATGPVVVVANHPYGIVDGLAACYLTGQRRTDFKVLLHHALCRSGRFGDYFLPVDFRESPRARKTNVRTLRAALRHVSGGGCVIVFPAGGIATASFALGTPRELPWKPFVARLILTAQAPVLPIGFAGQTSRLFQLASRMHTHLRLALVIHELRRHIGRTLRARAGALIPHADIAGCRDLAAITQRLRRRTLALRSAA